MIHKTDLAAKWWGREGGHISLHSYKLQSWNYTQTSPYQGKCSFMFLIPFLVAFRSHVMCETLTLVNKIIIIHTCHSVIKKFTANSSSFLFYIYLIFIKPNSIKCQASYSKKTLFLWTILGRWFNRQNCNIVHVYQTEWNVNFTHNCLLVS